MAMVYPARENGARRTVSLGYGESAGGVDDALGRVTEISSSPGVGGGGGGGGGSGGGTGGASVSLSKYSHAGMGRRVSLTLGTIIGMSLCGAGVPPASGCCDGGTASGYCGLDRFGRVTDLHYQYGGGGGGTLHRYQYGYDAGGSRTHARVLQKDGLLGGPNDNTRSYLYAYDGLNRLVDARMGTLDATNTSIVPVSGGGVIPRTTEWNLDNLGNWSGGVAPPGSPPGAMPASVVRTGDFAGTGTAVQRTTHHAVNRNNQITEVGDGYGPLGELPDSAASNATLHDPAGNLTFDGQWVYQYDGFNRLVQINELGAASLDSVTGQVLRGPLGGIVSRFSYDGLGRLIRKDTPIKVGNEGLQFKDLYYDGVRRVQEVITRPDDPFNPPPDFTRNEELADASTTAAGTPTGHTRWTDREYVYGPDYVDEFAAQFDRDGHCMLMPQDANYNVMAIVAGPGGYPNIDMAPIGGGGGTPATLPEGTVLEQYQYDPYGTLAATDTFFAHAVNRVGHQGLFFDRFDGDWDARALEPDAQGLYYNRNRHYSAALGRFLQRDPNGAGGAALSQGSGFGEIAASLTSSFNVRTHFDGGMCLYASYEGNPITTVDPLGLIGLTEMLMWAGDTAVGRALSTGGAAVAMKFFTSQQQMMLLTRAVMTRVESRMAAMGDRGYDFLLRANQVLTQNSGRLFNTNTYRAGFEWLYGKLPVNCVVHHIFPKGGELGRWFAERGIDPNNPLWLIGVDPEKHKFLHYQLNWLPRWRVFMQQYPTAKIDKVFDFARKLANEGGLEVMF